MARRTILDRLMAEPVRMPGMPSLIVSRAFVYHWALDRGYPHTGGFSSADYLAFGRRRVDAPLDAEDYRDGCVALMDRA